MTNVKIGQIFENNHGIAYRVIEVAQDGRICCTLGGNIQWFESIEKMQAWGYTLLTHVGVGA